MHSFRFGITQKWLKKWFLFSYCVNQDPVSLLKVPFPASSAAFLIVTFLTFQPTDVLNRHTIHFARFDIIMEFLVNAIELISFGTVIVEIHPRLPVTVNTPTHA
jgi:hypothetical protein